MTIKKSEGLLKNYIEKEDFKGYDPKFKYVTDRSTRGVWVDKFLASMNLFSRSSINKTNNGYNDNNYKNTQLP